MYSIDNLYSIDFPILVSLYNHVVFYAQFGADLIEIDRAFMVKLFNKYWRILTLYRVLVHAIHAITPIKMIFSL